MKTVRLADYYTGHVGRVKLVATGMIAAVNISLAILLFQLGFPFLQIALLILLPVILLQIFAYIIIVRYALEPLDMITRAITHVSNQANDVTPPRINEPRHEKTGLKMMIQAVYERVNEPQQTEKQTDNSFVESLPCGIIGIDANGTIVYANSRAPVVINSQGVTSLKLQFPTDSSLEVWLASAQQNKVSDEKFWERIADNIPDHAERRMYDVLALYEKDAVSGIETRIVTIDRTDSYSEVEEAVDFISVAAHELRGPITIIRGYLDVLADELKPLLQGDQKELIDRLDVSASRLSGYINNILNVAKYDRHHLKLHLTEDRLSNIYATIADDVQLRARTQHRLLNVSIPDDLPTIAADRNSLTEVMANLIDNAIKYSPEGGTVNVSAIDDGNYIVCSVQDKGIGMPPNVLNSLFTKFYRSHRSRENVSGTGLGLYISRAIIQSHGGQIKVLSREGEGSTFSFTVPIYYTVAEKLASGNNGNEGIIETSSGWIKNHGKIN